MTDPSSISSRPKLTANQILLIVLFGNLIRSIGFNAIAIGLPVLIVELASDITSYGIVLGIYTLIQTIFQAPMAWLSDYIGRKKVLIFAMSINALGNFLCGFANSIPQLIIFRIIQGIGAFSSVNFAIVGDIYPENQRYKANSYFNLSFTGGYLVGMVIGGLLADYIGARGIFFFCGGITIISIILIVIFLPDSSPHYFQESHEKFATLSNKQQFSLTFHELLNWKYLIGLCLTGLRSFTLMGLIALILWIFSVNFGIPSIMVSVYFLPITIIYMIFVILSERFAAKTSKNTVILWGFTQVIIAHLIIPLHSNLWWFWGFTIPAMIGFAIIDPAITTTITNAIPDRVRGIGTGLFHAVMFLSEGLGEILIPKWGAMFDIQGVYLITILFLVVGIILTLILRYKVSKMK